MQISNLEEQQEYLNAENQLRDATIGKLESMKGGMTRMITQAKLFTKALMANPIFLLAAVIVGLIALMKKFVTDTFALRDGLGASVTQAASLNKELQGARMEAFLMGYDVNQIAGELLSASLLLHQTFPIVLNFGPYRLHSKTRTSFLIPFLSQSNFLPNTYPTF